MIGGIRLHWAQIGSLLVTVLYTMGALAGEPERHTERRAAAEEARALRQNIGREFTLLDQRIHGWLLDCKAKVSLWQVSVSLGDNAPALPGGSRREVVACLDDTRNQLLQGAAVILNDLPVGHPAAVALNDYRATTAAMIGDFLPRTIGARLQSASDYDSRWTQMETAVKESAAGVYGVLEARHH